MLFPVIFFLKIAAVRLSIFHASTQASSERCGSDTPGRRSPPFCPTFPRACWFQARANGGQLSHPNHINPMEGSLMIFDDLWSVSSAQVTTVIATLLWAPILLWATGSLGLSSSEQFYCMCSSRQCCVNNVQLQTSACGSCDRAKQCPGHQLCKCLWEAWEKTKSLGLERCVLVLTLCRMPSPYPAEASEQSFHVFPHSKPTPNHGSARYPKGTQNFALGKHKYF